MTVPSAATAARTQTCLGCCKRLTLDEIAAYDFVLTPGRYVGVTETEGVGENFAEKMARLTSTLDAQFAESERLEVAIRENLRVLDFRG